MKRRDARDGIGFVETAIRASEFAKVMDLRVECGEILLCR